MFFIKTPMVLTVFSITLENIFVNTSFIKFSKKFFNKKHQQTIFRKQYYNNIIKYFCQLFFYYFIYFFDFLGTLDNLHIFNNCTTL